MKLGAKIFGVLSGVLIFYLLAGLILPGTWEADVDVLIPAPPSVVFPYLNRMDRWVLWNQMPESATQMEGPSEGVGTALMWDDAQYGEGQVRIVSSEEDSRVEYEVEVEGGALRIHGVLSLNPEGAGTRLHWVEQGDFGWNPLMGYAARGMAESQGEAMRTNVETLRALLEERSPGGDDPVGR